MEKLKTIIYRNDELSLKECIHLVNEGLIKTDDILNLIIKTERPKTYTSPAELLKAKQSNKIELEEVEYKYIDLMATAKTKSSADIASVLSENNIKLY